LAGRAGQISEQLDAVVERPADVIALQEISTRRYGPQREAGPLS
jgi:hypothetical protein